MLVLTRKVGETIRIGDDIVVTVLEMRRGQVRIGIDAPRQMRIVRTDARGFEPIGESSGSSAVRDECLVSEIAF